MRLNQPVLGMATTPNGKGYWLVAGDGGIFSFGDAKFFGSTGAMQLNQPIVGMAATPSGKGYWLVARRRRDLHVRRREVLRLDRRVQLNQPIVGMASTPSGKGYWLVAADGGIFTFGDAKFLGSTGGGAFGSMTGMAVTLRRRRVLVVEHRGSGVPVGSAPYYGDLYLPRQHRCSRRRSATAPKLQATGFSRARCSIPCRAATAASAATRFRASTAATEPVPRSRRGLTRLHFLDAL